MGLDPLTIATIANVGAGVAGVSSSRKAAKMQERASKRSAGAQERALESFEQRTDPFRLGGLAALGPLARSLGLSVTPSDTSAIDEDISSIQGIISDIEPQSFKGRAKQLDDLRGRLDELRSQRQNLLASPTIGMGEGGFMQGPMFKRLADDVQRRVFAGRAAGGGLGPAEVGTALQDALLGHRQQDISNLFNLVGLGSSAATGQGSAGMATAGGVGQALQAGGAAGAQGILGQSQAITGALGDVAGLGMLARGGFFGNPQ